MSFFFNFLEPGAEIKPDPQEPGESGGQKLDDGASTFPLFEEILSVTGKLQILYGEFAKVISFLSNKQTLKLPGNPQTRILPTETANELAQFCMHFCFLTIHFLSNLF